MLKPLNKIPKIVDVYFATESLGYVLIRKIKTCLGSTKTFSYPLFC